MGGALRYAMEILPRCAHLLHQAGGRLSLLLAGAEQNETWAQTLAACEHLHVDFVDAPMHPALRRALRETHAVQKWIDRSAAAGRPVHLVQTQSLPIPRLRFDGEQIHLCHGLRRLHTGSALARGFAKSLLRKGARELHSMLAVSETLSGELRELFPDLPLQSASPGCDHRNTLPRTPGRNPHVICVGPITPHKNHALLVESWSMDASLPPLRIHADLDDDLQARLEKLGLQDRISWSAPLTETTWPEALAGCAALILPSKLESFGLVALEALHAGVPLALSDLASHRELVGDAQDQVAFFDPTSPEGASQSLIRSMGLDSPESQKQRRLRAASFTWQDTAQRSVDHWCAIRPTAAP